jgi:uroporphyrinogen III methyltransferase/synthase
MTNSWATFRVGTRNSRLALLQTHSTLERLAAWLPGTRWDAVPMQTIGDRDLVTGLPESPPDFFTRELDDDLRAGRLDCAIHSAKDLPDPVPEGLDWCWLPWREDPRDALILPAGKSCSDLPGTPRIGISSARREAYCLKRFPGAQLLPIRGNIEERLAQLDGGKFDALLMAGAALLRLGLQQRINEWLPLDDLATPEGQGSLALTFRAGDPFFLRLRSLFVKAVVFVGGGAGRDALTLAGQRALRQAEICLYDVLMDQQSLAELPPNARRIDVGKRCGQHRAEQAAINALIARYARQGLRVVRLKGGDPGIFGRLAEEIDTLDALRLPYRVLPGISSLQAATTGTGMLLTRRGESRGFCVMTPRAQGGSTAPINGAARAALPVVFFMGADIVAQTSRELIADGTPPATPAALVFDAGGEQEKIVRASLDEFANNGGDGAADIQTSAAGANHSPSTINPSAASAAPGLFIVGEVTRYGYSLANGALQGRRILITCSEALQEKTADLVRDFGGLPVTRPLIRLVPDPAARGALKDLAHYDWLVVTSPSSVRCFAELLRIARQDVRKLPKIMVSGPGTATAVEQELGLIPDLQPSADFGAAGIQASVATLLVSGKPVLRIRSDKAGPDLTTDLKKLGLAVHDLVVYNNERIRYAARPECDAVFFASASAVEAYVDLWGAPALAGCTILAIGTPTTQALERAGLRADVMGFTATVEGAITALAAHIVSTALHEHATGRKT